MALPDYSRLPSRGNRYSTPRQGPASVVVPLPFVTQKVVPSEPEKLRFRVLTAASKRIETKGVMHRPTAATWQSEAWALADQVGELRYAANLYANGLSRIKLEITRKLPDKYNQKVRLCDLSESEITDRDRQVLAIFDEIVSHQPLDEMLRVSGLNLFVAGECLLVGVPEPGSAKTPLLGYSWKIYSREDVQEKNGVVIVCGKEYDESAVVLVRIWRPHPRLAREADSPVRACLPILRELVGLTMYVSAIIDSRLAGAGILLLPTSATVLGATPPEDDQESDPTVEALIESMITPIKDRDSAASVVPLILTAPDESVDAIRHISFSSQLETAAKDLRDEAIRRLALGLDMPPEELLGAAGASSHWGAWLVQEDNVKLWLVPGSKLFVEALIKDLIHPILMEMGWGEEEVDLYDLECVADHMFSRPNRFDEAMELYKVDAISLAAVLEAGGFDLKDAPEQKEVTDRAVDLAIKAVSINPSLFESPGLPNLVSQLRAVLSGQDAGSAPPDALPPAMWKESEVEEAQADPKTPATGTNPDRKPNEPGPAKTRERDQK